MSMRQRREKAHFENLEYKFDKNINKSINKNNNKENNKNY